MIRKILLTSPPIWAAVAVKKNESAEATKEAKNEHYKCRPSDLPLYAPLHDANKPKAVSHPPKNSAVSEAIESGIRVVRVEFESGYNAVTSQKDKFNDVIETGKGHSKFVFDYLNEPDNTFPRVGAIAIGALSGLILALRGGFIKRILYSGIGAGAVASVCYPEEAGVYAQKGLSEAKKGVNIAYNFAVGAKPGDDQFNLPKFPTTISQLTDSITDLAKSAKDAVFSSKK